MLGVTILPDTSSHFNGKNYASWKLQLTELLKGKGLWGYIAGTTVCPATPATTTTAMATTTPLLSDSTPIYSSEPSYDEWVFHDQLTHSHIVLNILDPIGLGVKTDRTAKECWDSVAAEHAKEINMALSEAEVSLNTANFDGNSDINIHIANLCMKWQAVNDLQSMALSDQEFKRIIIHSIISTDHWMPILPSLYSMPMSSDVIFHLQTHAATLCAVGKGPANSQALVAGAGTPVAVKRDTDSKMPAFSDVDDNDDEVVTEDKNEEMPPLVGTDASKKDVESIGHFTCKADPTMTAFVTTTFEGHTPAITLTFIDSGASDYFFRNCNNFMEYMPVAFHTGLLAVEGKGTFNILGQSTATKVFRLNGRDVKLMFKNALQLPSLATNLISISALDKAGLSTVFSDGHAVVCDKSGKEIFAG
ncbi:hypothetical protein IW262DRAFT_1459279 [Armillaria fumosa]|nr:hypothetical protein IW262DRAFT_1459279 [Armillaria fumosa]